MQKRDFLSIADLSADDILKLIKLAVSLKQQDRPPLLAGKTLALIFEHPSLRTRVSFEVGMQQLGGRAIYLSQSEVGLGQRESVSDVARVLSRYVDVIVTRTFYHRQAQLIAEHATVPVINGLSDEEHPCQALADLLTIYEKKGRLKGVTIAFVGDANNVANSLLLGASLVGANFQIASPPGYQLKEGVLKQAQGFAAESGCEILCTERPQAAVRGADVVYTDVWTSMGQEAEAERRRADFAGYQVTAQLLALAREGALLMHPLPAHHGEEVASGLIDCPQSVVFDQAENRMHAQKALLVDLLGDTRIEATP